MKQVLRWLGLMGDQIGLLIVLILLIAGFALTTRGWLSADMFKDIARQIPPTVMVAVGMTYVLVIGGIDLSVGSVLALSGAAMGLAMTSKQPATLGAAAALAVAVGLVCGFVNGAISVTWAIPSFVVTLGMLEVARGLTHRLTHSQTAYVGSRAAGIAQISWLGLGLPFWIAMGTVVLGQLVLSKTVFGRYMIAVGTNEEAVRLSGIRTRPIKIAVFVIAGALAGAGAVLRVTHKESADPNAGTGLELTVIAAVVIGGTSLLGGRGSVVSTLLGVVILEVLESGLASRGELPETKRIITGCVIVLAAILDYYRHRLSLRRS